MMMKKLLFLALLLCAVLRAGADTWTDSEGISWTYTASGSNATDVKPTDIAAISGAVSIPSTINGLTVTSIANRAFHSCVGLTGVTIPSTVTNIGELAFYGCSSLTEVTLPSSVETIGQGAFYNCTGLTSVTIPEGVTKISDTTFSRCSKLASVTIPESVTTIGNGAFSNCSALTSVIIPESMTSIGNTAFASCSALTSVTIPEGVTSIGNHAFLNCSQLTSVYIKAPSLTTYGSNAFNNNADGRKIYVPADAVDTYKAGWSAYKDDIVADAYAVGRVLCTDGSICTTISEATNSGRTAVGMIAYLDTEKNTGLAIAFADEGNGMISWYNAVPAAADHQPTVTFGTWKLPTLDEWNHMFKANGGIENSYAGLNTAINNAGGTVLQNAQNMSQDCYYWTSTTYSDNTAQYLTFNDGVVKESYYLKSLDLIARACLAFYIPKTVMLAETDDNTSWLTANNGKVYDVMLTRTLQTGSYNTFAVPFSMAIPSGWTVKQLTASAYDSSTGVLTLTFATAETIEAGKPYLVKVSETVENPTFEGVTVSNETTPTVTGAVTFQPTLGKTLVTGDGSNANDAKTVLFLGGGNKLFNPTVVNNAEQEASYMKGFRAYFQLTGEAAQASSLASSYVMDFGDGDQTTGIISLTPALSQGEEVWYTLDGRKLQGRPTAKGMYIVNGKKVIK